MVDKAVGWRMYSREEMIIISLKFHIVPSELFSNSVEFEWPEENNMSIMFF